MVEPIILLVTSSLWAMFAVNTVDDVVSGRPRHTGPVLRLAGRVGELAVLTSLAAGPTVFLSVAALFLLAATPIGLRNLSTRGRCGCGMLSVRGRRALVVRNGMLTVGALTGAALSLTAAADGWAAHLTTGDALVTTLVGWSLVACGALTQLIRASLPTNPTERNSIA